MPGVDGGGGDGAAGVYWNQRAYIYVPITVPIVVTTPSQKTDAHVIGTLLPFGILRLNGITCRRSDWARKTDA